MKTIPRWIHHAHLTDEPPSPSRFLPTSLLILILPRRLSARPFRLFRPPRALRRPSRPTSRLGLIAHLLRSRAFLHPPHPPFPSTLTTSRRWRIRTVLLRGIGGGARWVQARVKVLHDGDGRELFLVRVLILALGPLRLAFFRW